MPRHWLTGARTDGRDRQRPSWPWSWGCPHAGALVHGLVTTTTLMTVMG